MDRPSDRYAEAGVDYGRLDSAKRLAVQSAAGTAPLLVPHSAEELPDSRGQSAFVFRLHDRTLATVLECLGTKSLLAEEFWQLTQQDHWAAIATDTVAAVVNDLASVGAVPLVVHAYFATGSPSFYDHPTAYTSLIHGWEAACRQAGATWGGGETPTLPGLVAQTGLELAGSAVGIIPEGREPLLGNALAPGDEIVLVASSGLHANGASLARRIAGRTAGGLLHRLPSGRLLGEALLEPSVIYVPLIRALLDQQLPVTFVSHITGHGLRKVMRAPQQLRYAIGALPPVPEALGELAALGGLAPPEAYGTFNMGAGLAVMCRPGNGDRVVELAGRQGHRALVAGHVQRGPRSVVLAPVDVVFAEETLQLG